jgi:predicted NBD/HSP70 family sugar kinase
MRKIPELWLSNILLTLYQRAAVTREEIVRSAGLNGGSVSQALRFLADAGTVLKVGELRSNGGRRRDVLTLNPEAGYFIAVDLETARIRYALTSLVGDIRFRWEQDVELGRGLDSASLLSGLEIVKRNLEPWQRSRLLAVGISCPGTIEEDQSITAVNLGWRRFPLLDKLAEATSLPLFLGASCRNYVLAEQGVGVARDCNNCIYVELGKGIGAGIVIDRRYLEGTQHMAGEFGHITIDPNGEDECNCGKKGCLEAIASISSIVRQYKRLSGRASVSRSSVSVGEIFDKARNNDPLALRVLERAGQALGLGLSHLIILFNPGLVILGGELLQGQDVLVPIIRRELALRLPGFCPPTQVIVTNLGLDIGLKGAALLAFQNSVTRSDVLKTLTTPLAEVMAATSLEQR